MDPKWSRPEWMICTVLPICPPATRPSAKIENMTQRQEDDITYKYVEIIHIMHFHIFSVLTLHNY